MRHPLDDHEHAAVEGVGDVEHAVVREDAARARERQVRGEARPADLAGKTEVHAGLLTAPIAIFPPWRRRGVAEKAEKRYHPQITKAFLLLGFSSDAFISRCHQLSGVYAVVRASVQGLCCRYTSFC